MTRNTDDYPDSPAYRDSFEDWLSPHNRTLPEHLTAGQVASIGFIPTAVHNTAVTSGEQWAEFVWDRLNQFERERLFDHLCEVLGDIFQALPGYADDAARWAHDGMLGELADAEATGWVQR